jgi:hypothetical protein
MDALLLVLAENWIMLQLRSLRTHQDMMLSGLQICLGHQQTFSDIMKMFSKYSQCGD